MAKKSKPKLVDPMPDMIENGEPRETLIYQPNAIRRQQIAGDILAAMMGGARSFPPGEAAKRALAEADALIALLDS